MATYSTSLATLATTQAKAVSIGGNAVSAEQLRTGHAACSVCTSNFIRNLACKLYGSRVKFKQELFPEAPKIRCNPRQDDTYAHFQNNSKKRLAIPVSCLPGIHGRYLKESDDHMKYPRKAIEFKEGKSILLRLLQEIEPLDISHISKDAFLDSLDAMKRTISGMLGLLPSDQFRVTIEFSPEHLSHLLVSSMMTGYTLRNAEYRFCLQKNLELPLTRSDSSCAAKELNESIRRQVVTSEQARLTSNPTAAPDESCGTNFTVPESLGQLTPEAQQYIEQLHSTLASVTQQLENCKQVTGDFEVDSLEKNDLLSYLRSMDPDKVAELSKPTSEVELVVCQFIEGLLDTLPIQRSTDFSGAGLNSTGSTWGEGSFSELHTAGILPFKSVATREYLARLLFWCMLLGHYLRGLEYRLELNRVLRLSQDMGHNEGNQDSVGM
eukprot:c24130_g1_i1 orf=682-1995(+)